MSDNITAPIAGGTILAADDVSGVLYPRTKVSFGLDGSAVDVSAAAPLPIDTVVRGTSVNRSGTAGTSAVNLMGVNLSRRGFVVQNQSDTAFIYINALGAAAADNSSLRIGPGGYYESQSHHIGTAAISIISTEANTPVYAREW